MFKTVFDFASKIKNLSLVTPVKDLIATQLVGIATTHLRIAIKRAIMLGCYTSTICSLL
ncbi:MAG: hypothetical protein IKI11_08455 [Neisseriaceae bacterium]|nr:hypothetical protein [Neisseriaceae bacterium]MBR7002674.1 hypothetical protein [Neisseriaceae bacterium]